VLYEIGLTISRFLELDEIIEYAVDQAKRLMASDLVWYLDCCTDGKSMAYIRNASGRAPPEFHTGAPIPLVGRVAALLEPGGEARRFLMLDDIVSHRARDLGGAVPERPGELFCDPAIEKRFLELGMRSALFVPVGDGSHSRGLLCSFAERTAAHAESHVDVMRRLANQLLMALNSTDLHSSRRALAVMEERQRLSNELHDNMSQIVNGLSLELHSITRLAGRQSDNQSLLDRLERIHGRLADAKAAIRQAIYQLRLPDNGDLWANLKDFSERFERWHDLRVHTELPETPLALPLPRQREVIRIVQEALWNACKHSGSRSARLSGRHEPDSGRILVEVADGGKGGDPESLERGQGVATMRDRATRLRGNLTISPNSDRGLTVTLELTSTPLP
jgi:signal transduction histidine kinase